MSHLRYLMGASAMNFGYKVRPDDILYTVLPLYHSAGGMLGAGSVVWCGLTMVIARKFSASRFWKECALYNATVTQYVCSVVSCIRRVRQLWLTTFSCSAGTSVSSAVISSIIAPVRMISRIGCESPLVMVSGVKFGSTSYVNGPLYV